MPYNRSLKFRAAAGKDFPGLEYVLYFMAIISALLSSYPLFLSIIAALLFATGRILLRLGFFKISNVKLISVIFPSGQVTIESNDKVEGFLSGHQWCTRHAAILRYEAGGRLKRTVLLARHQDADDYRRLRVCLQHNFCNDTGKNKVSAIGPRTGYK